MNLSKEDQGILRAIIERLQTLSMYAADPHVDCRDEMAGILNQIDELVEELFSDDQGEADKPAVAGELPGKGGGA